MSCSYRYVHLVLAVLGLTAAVCSAEAEPGLQGGGIPSGPGVIRDHVWTQVTGIVVNPTPQTIEALVVTSLAKTPNFQFATRVVLPPHSRQRVIQPLRVFEAPMPEGNDAFVKEDVTTILIDPSVVPEQQLALYEGLLQVNRRFPIVAFIGDGGSDGLAQEMTSFAMDIPGRRARPTESGRIPLLRQKTLLASQAPRFAAGWEAVESLVIAQDQPELDAAQIEAIRQWLVGGGRLWLLLDQVPARFATRLLGGDFTCRVIQRVSLSQVDLVGLGQNESFTGAPAFETPIRMARVLAPGFEVMHTADGWPASMRRRVGRGELLLTTVGPRAWVDARGQPRRPLNDLRSTFLPTDAAPRQADDTLAKLITSRIGYKVMGRGPVALVFLLMVAALLGSGLWLQHRGRRADAATRGGLERIGLFGIALALVATVALTGISAASHGTIPKTVAGLQLVWVAPSQRIALVRAVLGFFTPGPEEPIVVESDNGGLIWMEPEIFQGGSPRMTWTDFDRWSWEQPELQPNAMRMAKQRGAVRLDQSVSVNLGFGEEQMIVGIEPGPLRKLVDPVLVGPNGHLLPDRDGDRFVIPAGQAPGPDQYVVGTGTLDDEQKSHQDVMRALAADPHAPMPARWARQPLLLVWGNALDLGMNYAPNAKHDESALFAIPVTVTRPAPDTLVRIPKAFIPFRAEDPLGQFKSAPYVEAERQWVTDISRPQTFVIRFQLPPEVTPLQVTEARLTVSVKAKNWTFSVCDPYEKDLVVLKADSSPMGESVVDLVDLMGTEALMKSADQGAIYVKFDVSGAPADSEAVWRIESMHLQVEGRTAAPQADGSTP